MRQCFLFNEKLNFQDFYMKIGMYVHFCHTKRYSQKKIEKFAKVAELRKWPKFSICQEKSIFL